MHSSVFAVTEFITLGVNELQKTSIQSKVSHYKHSDNSNQQKKKKKKTKQRILFAT